MAAGKRAQWRLGWLSEPPIGVAVWCLIQPPGDAEPYLIECEARESNPLSVKTFDGGDVNWLPPHHEIVAWRQK